MKRVKISRNDRNEIVVRYETYGDWFGWRPAYWGHYADIKDAAKFVNLLFGKQTIVLE